MGPLEWIRRNTDKESKINNVDCLLGCSKVRQQSLTTSPRAVPHQIPACGEPGPRRAGYLGRGRHPVWDAERSCSFFTLLGEQNQKGRLVKLCGNPQRLWCYSIVCCALQAIKHLLISNGAFHSLPTPSAALDSLPCSLYPQAFTLIEMLMKTSQLNEGKTSFSKKRKSEKPHPNQNPSCLQRTRM